MCINKNNSDRQLNSFVIHLPEHFTASHFKLKTDLRYGC